MKRRLNCILLIDDNPITNLFSKKLIEKLNIAEQIHIAENGQEGLDYLNNKGKYNQDAEKNLSPNLIFLDINMPVMDGWEFLDEFAKIPPEQKGSIVIIMLSTSPNPEDRQKARHNTSVIEYKIKPLSKEMLIEIMENHFNISL